MRTSNIRETVSCGGSWPGSQPVSPHVPKKPWKVFHLTIQTGSNHERLVRYIIPVPVAAGQEGDETL